MRALALLLIAAAVLVSTAAARLPSGIGVIVIKGPTSPVCREGVPCTAPAGGIRLVFDRAGRHVAAATTQRNGTARVVLAPGRYVVRVVLKSPFAVPGPRTVVVRTGRFTTVRFEIDTGIR